MDLQEARVRGALAWLHAGELDLAEQALVGLGDRPLPPALELLAAAVELGAAIDRDADGAAIDARIGALLAEADPASARERHRALGTRGRWRLHRRDPAALPLLEAAVEAAPDWERGRSRLYLAMALRETGRADEALAELGRAEGELEAHTRRRSLSYYAETRIYLRYEQARAALAGGEAERAGALAREALDGARPGFWPRAGILRVLARAERASGRVAGAERAVAEIEALVAEAPDAMRGLLDALLAEARGEGTEPPVVY